MEYAFIGIVVVLLALGGFFAFKKFRKREPAYMAIVRRFVSEGRYERAGDVHYKNGNLTEAINLYVRAEVFHKACNTALEAGNTRNAAKFAEKAEDYDKAGELYEQQKDFKTATRMFMRSTNFERAANAMEKDSDASLLDIANLWETACLDAIPDDLPPEQIDEQLKHRIRDLAQRAGTAHRTAGNLDRGTMFLRIAGTDTGDDDQEHGGNVGGLDKLSRLGTIFGGVTAPQQQTHSNTAMVAPVVRDGSAAELQAAVSGVAAAGGPVVQREVVYIRDAMTNEEKAVRRETDRYLIGEKLGEGGMAVVHRATDNVLERDVAMKFLPEGFTQNPMALRFFEREAKSAASLNHPNIMTVHDFGIIDGRPFICMELIDGIPLDERLEALGEHYMPLPELLHIAEGLLAALDYAHRQELVHRDIKPSNVMMTRDGHVKLMDFGIAKGIDPEKSTMIVGTPAYMAPEQFEGKGIDHRSDIFAVGVTLYELTTGRMPFEAMRRQHMPQHRPSDIRQDVPRMLDTIVWRSMQLNPGERYQSTAELLAAVRRVKRRVDAQLEEGAVPSTPPMRTVGPPLDDHEETLTVLKNNDEPSETFELSEPDEVSIDTLGEQVANLFEDLPSQPSEPAPSASPSYDDDLDALPGALSLDETLLPNALSLEDVTGSAEWSMESGASSSEPDSLPRPPGIQTGDSANPDRLINELESLFEKHSLVNDKSDKSREQVLLETVRDLKDRVESGFNPARSEDSSISSTTIKVGGREIPADAIMDINTLLYEYTTNKPLSVPAMPSKQASPKPRKPATPAGMPALDLDGDDDESRSNALRGLSEIETMLLGYLSED